ncbi:MAG: HEAT repeat domain-containing protein [Anaerolineae bacterium]|nr:HEAT repeat domain-containing protein [Anaerolineae bacterium]
MNGRGPRWVWPWMGMVLVLAACALPAPEPATTSTVIPELTPAFSWERSLTPGPPPDPESLVEWYREKQIPLVDRLQAAGEPPQDFRLPDLTHCQVLLVPLSERLFPVQEILFPGGRVGGRNGDVRLYVAYSYRRGAPLGRESGFPTDTQEVLVQVRLIAGEGDRFYLLEEKEGVGGPGSFSAAEMVRRAVSRLDGLGEAGASVETILETIIGYAVGLDWDLSLPLERRRTVLIWALRSPYWADRKYAVMALEKLGPAAREAIPALTRVLEDGTPDVRGRAVRALGDIGPEAIPALTLALGDGDPRIRKSAIWELGKIGPDAVPILTELLWDEDPEIRRHAVWALGDIGREGVPGLIQALRDEDPDVRWAAAWTLGEIGPKAEDAVPALIEALRDEDPDVRRTSAWALGAIGVQREGVVPALIQTLEGDEDPSARELAAWALGALRPKVEEVVPALIRALGDDHPEVRWVAASALETVTGQDFGPDTLRWQSWWEEQKHSEGGSRE